MAEWASVVSALRDAEQGLDHARNAASAAMAEARRAAGLTQGDVAKEAGVSVPYVSDIEAGRRAPALRVCEALLRLVDAADGSG